MTNEEAIKILEVAQVECEWNAPLEYQEAFNMAIEALKEQPKHDQNTPQKQPDLETLCIKTCETCEDVIRIQDAIELANSLKDDLPDDERIADTVMAHNEGILEYQTKLSLLPSEQPERLTDDDFETIRIHLSAFKEQLCNQHRWKEAEEYQRIIDRFMSFANAQPEIIHCKECKFAHMTYEGDCKYCDVWFPDESVYVGGDYYCASAERKTDG